MEHSTPELILYVREQLSAGFTRSALEATLAQAGWTTQAIEETFRLLVEQHKTVTPEPIIPEPVIAQEFSPEPTLESMAVSNQLDQLLSAGTQPTQSTQQSVSPSAPTETDSQPLQTAQETAPQSTEPFNEPFVDTPADQKIVVQEDASIVPPLLRDTGIQSEIAYAIPDGTSDTIMPAEAIQTPTKHNHHWWQILILVILIAMTLGLLLLVLQSLNVYEALSINTPVWADSILSWIQSLFSGKA